MSLKGWFEKLSVPEFQGAERKPAPGFTAYHWIDSIPKQNDIRDISSTGIYLLTEERWLPGTLVSLTLQRKGPLETSSERRITLQAQARRWGDDGVGLSFVLPKDLDTHLWESLLASAADQTEPDDILGQFRIAEAVAFLSRICPAATEQVRQLIRGGLSSYRVASAVEIALKAETLLAPVPNGDGMRAPQRLVVRIVEDGSWADEEWIREMWAGLLATSCTENGNDESNLVFIGLFSQLAAIHIRILTAACTKATKVVSETGTISAKRLLCSIEEIIKVTGSRDLLRIARDHEHLYALGLLEKGVHSPSLLPIDDSDITPSRVGLELYAICNGHRGSPLEFYGVGPTATAEARR